MSQNYEQPTRQWPDSKPEQSSQGHPPTEQISPDRRPGSVGYAGVVGSSAVKTELLNTSPPTFAWLVMLEGLRPGKIYHLNPDSTTIGRDIDCDIIIDDSAVSRQHVKIRLIKNDDNQKEFVLHDLATPNGTKLNGQEVVKEPLQDGDRIEIGRTVLVFKRVD